MTRRVLLVRYLRRLLTPPLPGDGLLVVGLLVGVVGWTGSYLLAVRPGLSPVGPVGGIVALWTVLTLGLYLVGVGLGAPTVRTNRIWAVWGLLSLGALTVNGAALAGLLPPGLAVYALWRPWFVVIAVGYLVTAGYDWSNPQLRQGERVVYAIAGVVAALVVVVSTARFIPVGRVFLLGGLLHVLPIGFDVGADLLLVLR